MHLWGLFALSHLVVFSGASLRSVYTVPSCVAAVVILIVLHLWGLCCHILCCCGVSGDPPLWSVCTVTQTHNLWSCLHGSLLCVVALIVSLVVQLVAVVYLLLTNLHLQTASEITEEVTQTIEELILQRIKDKAFDDNQRQVRPREEAYELKTQKTLDQEKSKLSLHEVYEQEYLKLQAVSISISLCHKTCVVSGCIFQYF